MTVHTTYQATCTYGHVTLHDNNNITHCPECGQTTTLGWKVDVVSRKTDVDKMKVLHRLIEHCEEHNLYLDIYDGVAEPGYDDQILICADWNDDELKPIGDWIEKYFDDVDTHWSDEWSGCSHCGKAVKTSPDSYHWQPSYILTECEFICRECWEEFIEEIIDEYLNDHRKAIPSDLYPLVEKEGFVCYSPDEYCQRFATGWYPGQNDDPESVANDIKENLPDHDYLFKLDSVGQFDVHWSVYLRKREEDNDYI